MKRTFPTRQRTICFVAIASVVFAATGCQEKVYQIEQWARGEKLWRRLTVSRQQQGNGAKQDLSESDKAEIARIAKLYGSEAPKIAGQRATFVGAFAGDLPHDVGGDGHYVHWASPLGSVSVYVERFRGNDDLAAVLEARGKSVDQIVDLVIGWFDSELHDVADWPALRKFLDLTFRRDLHNLSLYGWLAGVRPESESKNSDIAFRVIQYLVERHYASYEDAPALLREFSGLNQRDESQSFFARIRRLLLARAGAPADGHLARRLGFLKDARSAWASWRHYFQTTPFYQRELAEFRRRKEEEERQRAKAAGPAVNAGVQKREHPVVAIDREEFERNLYLESFNAFLDLNTGDSTRVQTSLETPREPFWTNGKYNAKQRRVEWSQQIPEVGQAPNRLSREWPGFCCAAWDDPNEQAQKQLLGTVGIMRDRLFDYNLWYQGLSSREKQEWDAFLPTVRGDAKYADRLEAFVFSDEPAGRKGSESLAFDGSNAVLQVLGPPKRGEGQIWINGVPLFPKSPDPRKKDVDPRD
jgi:hypothetical protein